MSTKFSTDSSRPTGPVPRNDIVSLAWFCSHCPWRSNVWLCWSNNWVEFPHRSSPIHWKVLVHTSTEGFKSRITLRPPITLATKGQTSLSPLSSFETTRGPWSRGLLWPHGLPLWRLDRKGYIYVMPRSLGKLRSCPSSRYVARLTSRASITRGSFRTTFLPSPARRVKMTPLLCHTLDRRIVCNSCVMLLPR